MLLQDISHSGALADAGDPAAGRVPVPTDAHELVALGADLPAATGLPIGEQLVAAGMVTREALAEALAIQARVPGRRLGWILVVLGQLSQEDLDRVLAWRVGVRSISITRFRPAPGLRSRLSLAHVRRLGIALLHEDERTAWVAFADATDARAREAAGFALGKRVLALHAPRSQIAALHRAQESGATDPRVWHDASHRRRDALPEEAPALRPLEFPSHGIA
jgi:hypothetical protein